MAETSKHWKNRDNGRITEFTLQQIGDLEQKEQLISDIKHKMEGRKEGERNSDDMRTST